MIDLNFDAEKAYTGTYSYSGIEYENYRITYCGNPITGLIWSGIPSEDFFKMNIKVPLFLSAEERCTAKILYYNPWGGDYGQPAPDPETLDNPMKELALRNGWILIEPGMRGTNCYTGTPGEADFCHYGKLPRPLADLKAGLRYLRYENNKKVVPGDKERIWIAGVSSGGCASSIIGTSGDAQMFAPYLEEIGAAKTSDAVYGSAPSCPVMNRGNLDAALAFERWYGQDMSEADPVNRGLVEYYKDYFDTLLLRAERNVEEAGIKKGDPLTHQNIGAYCYSYVKDAGRKFFSRLGSRAQIENYLTEKKPADPMYGTPETDRSWIRTVYDPEGKFTDFDGSYDAFWRYVVGDERYDRKNRVNMQCDRAISGPDRIFEKNGIVNIGAGYGFGAAWGEPSTPSFGKPEEVGTVFTEFGQKWLTEQRDMTISGEYRKLIGMQRDSVDPMYFIQGKGGACEIAKRWFLRTGTVDQVTPHPNFIALGTALMNGGMDVDLAFVWDEVHGLTSELGEFMEFAKKD